MSTLIALFVIAILAGLLTLFIFQLKKSTEKLDANQQITDQIRIENIRLSTQLQSAHEQLDVVKKGFESQEKQLKTQLQLMAESFVQKGTTQMKLENEQQLHQLLKPFQEKLNHFQLEVRDQKEKGIEQFASMKEMVMHLHQQSISMHSTAQNLVDALRGEQKMQGDWGEFALERILETSGLEKGIDYKTQGAFKDDDGNLQRPDVVIYLPDNKHIVVDAKVSMVAFERYINAVDAQTKREELIKHIQSLRIHIRQLGEKNYSNLHAIESPEFVLLFIPLESSFALAIKEEPSLYEAALSKKVVLVTPSTLLATLKTVSSIWKYEKQTKNALEIATQAGKLYDKFVGFITDMEKIGQKQSEAQKAYAEALSKLHEGNGNLVRSAEKLRELGVKSKKEIDKKYID